jgi:hypothetical protein
MNTITTNHKIHKLSKVPSDIAPAKQAWIPTTRSINSSINAAQRSSQNMLHIALNGGLANAAEPGIYTGMTEIPIYKRSTICINKSGISFNHSCLSHL